MSPGNNTMEFAFLYMYDGDLQVTIVVVIMTLVWGVAYMGIINHKLFFYFNETVFNSLLGAAVGMLIGGSESFKRLVAFFLPWENYENNILPFMLIYPASKLCFDASKLHFRHTLMFTIINGALCVALDTCAILTFLSTRSGMYSSDSGSLSLHHLLFAVYISASISIYDAYLCVHNFPEIRGHSHTRAFLSCHGLLALCFALELRQMALQLANETEITVSHVLMLGLKRVTFTSLVSALLGITAGLVSSYITKLSSFLQVEQEMVVLPCSNYIAYTVAMKTGLSPIITSIACEAIQGTYSINNVSEASKITYKSMLAKTSKLLGFFCTFSLGFQFGSYEHKHLWRFVSIELFGVFLGVTVLARILSTLLSYWCVRRLGFQMRSHLMFLQVMIHTRATPSLMSLVNMQTYSRDFQMCEDRALSIQWSLYAMCTFVNLINVPLVGMLYRRLKIEPDIVDNQAEPIFQVIFKLMYREMGHQIMYLSGNRGSCIWLLLGHTKKNFLRYVMSLGFMSVPERKSPILSAYDRAISQRSNVIDQRRKSVRSKSRIYATQVCANFIVRNLASEGFNSDDITEYFVAGNDSA